MPSLLGVLCEPNPPYQFAQPLPASQSLTAQCHVSSLHSLGKGTDKERGVLEEGKHEQVGQVLARGCRKTAGRGNPNHSARRRETSGEHLLVLRVSQRYPATQMRDMARPSQVNG